MPSTLGDLVRLRADSPRQFVFLDDRGRPSEQTYADVARGAAHYARVLVDRGIRKGDRVVLMLPTRPEYLYAFFGTILAGAIPVPVYPPFNPNQLKGFLTTLAGVFSNSGARALLYWQDVKLIVGEALAHAPQVDLAVSLSDFGTAGPWFEPPAVELSPSDTAMLQYTSGSTDMPKGVELTHRNLLHNVEGVRKALELVPGVDRVASWLPLYHDMGLIGVMIGAIYSDIDLILMGPQSFLMRPKLWLQALSEYKATITVAPNFAYNLCATRIPDSALAGLDLSSVRVAMCGAEPIRQESVEGFLSKMAPLGFRREAFLPVYGLAESTVAATFPAIEREATILWIDRDGLEGDRQARPVEPGSDRAVPAYGCGRPFDGSALRIADPRTDRELPEGQVGEIRLKGPSVMKGYYADPERTAEVFDSEGWLKTGDLGFSMDGHVFITGRLKDLIIRNGRNYYPQDLEFHTEQIEGVRKGCVIAFGHLDPQRGTEEVVLLVESRFREDVERDALASRIREALHLQMGLVPDTVAILPPHTLLKTSSGKLRRRPTRDMFLSGRLAPRRDSLLDKVKVVAGSQLHWGHRRLRALFDA